MQGFTSYLKVSRVFVHLERLLLSFEAVTSRKEKRMRCDTFGSCVSVSFFCVFLPWRNCWRKTDARCSMEHKHHWQTQTSPPRTPHQKGFE